MNERDQVRVTVHYMAAGKPFEQEYPRTTPVSAVKAAAMTRFGLSEGVDGEGNTVSYPLYHDKTVVENLGQTVADLAGHQSVLQLKLSQQITQG